MRPLHTPYGGRLPTVTMRHAGVLFLQNPWELICHPGVLRLRARRAIWEGKVMPKGTGWLSLIGFLGLAVAADAQTPLSQTAGSQFDGTYALVSSTKLTETFTQSQTGRMRPCPDWQVGPLTIVGGQARVSFVSTSHGVHADFDGMVGSQGELVIRSVNPAYDAPAERLLNGRIDGTGTVRAHLLSGCSFDYVWRK